ncbi:MAG: hypothetical protein COB02_12945 [Candidatus Cloacimonadota bacterium]|nr:MAG: hypothetical protein COB02_12945 [Candidatus Cloacimonadota bacterium]
MKLYKKCTNCKNTYETFICYQNQTSFVGILRTGKFKDHNLELRDCSCGSTLATEIPKFSKREKRVLWETSSIARYKKKKNFYVCEATLKSNHCAKKNSEKK